MTFEQIEFFIAVVESDTFFDAAETLHTTQSNVSKQMKKLEKELDLPLFDRSKRSAHLTDGGRAFYSDARKIYALYQQTLTNIRKFQSESANVIRIGTLPVLSQYSLTGIMKKFTEQFPHIRLSLTEAEETELQAGLKENKFDVLIARSSMMDEQCHAFYPIASDRLTAILPADSPFSRKETISIEEICKEPFLLMPSFTSVYQTCLEQFEKAGVRPCILRTARMESLISAVAIGEGVTLLPEKNFDLFRHDGIVSIPLDPEVSLPIGCIRNKNAHSAAAAKFIHFVQDHKM